MAIMKSLERIGQSLAKMSEYKEQGPKKEGKTELKFLGQPDQRKP
ncbi:MAG: hypothetical protein WBZ33_15160 [Thermoactinomyces sp.]